MNKAKYLGQHFLKNRKILEEMARAAGLTKKPARNATHSVAGGDAVLEVGPGTGTLTEVLAERAGKVIAVEKDRELVTRIMKHETLFKNKNVAIIHGDILRSETWLQEFNASCSMLHASGFKVVANIPYYITSRFLRLFLTHPPTATQLLAGRPKLMVLMIQREVAERICARDGKESLLSLSVKAYAKPEIVRIVSRGAFSPPPKVDSAIIKITPYLTPRFASPLLRKEREKEKINSLPPYEGGRVRDRGLKFDPEKVLSLARIAFQKKRKMLRHSIGKKITLPEKYQTKRPEALSLEDWAAILSA